MRGPPVVVKLIYSFFTVISTLVFIRQLNFNPDFEITVESGTQLKTVHICSALVKGEFIPVCSETELFTSKEFTFWTPAKRISLHLPIYLLLWHLQLVNHKSRSKSYKKVYCSNK